MTTTEILIVDDSPDILSFFDRELKQCIDAPNVSIVLANGPAEAKELFATHTDIRYIICDVHMPHQSGFEFIDDLPRTATGKLQRFRLRAY